MKEGLIKCLLLSAIICFMAVISGCASLSHITPTTPNQIYEGPYPPKFYALAQKNPLLAKELGKLLEMQNGISNTEASAIEQMVNLYKSDPESFDIAFRRMYQVGKPEVRKYCTPLQALLWLAEKQRNKELSQSLKYCVSKLPSHGERPFFERHDILFLLAEAWDFSDNHKWKEPDQVMDRLNSPELLEYCSNIISLMIGRHSGYRLHRLFHNLWKNLSEPKREYVLMPPFLHISA